MSNEQSQPSLFDRFSAASMVRPTTNCSPMMRTAAATASTDHRLAQTADDALQEAGQVGFGLFVGVDQLAGQHQAPGRGVDEQAVGLAEVRGPVGRADLLGDQAVAGVLVGGAQQGLGQAHQGQTLAGAERELLQEAFDHALLLLAGAGVFDEARCGVDHNLTLGGVQRDARQIGGDGLTLVWNLSWSSVSQCA
jgi:hypothetical protein